MLGTDVFDKKLQDLGLCFFGPPFLTITIVGPSFKPIWSSFSFMAHLSSTIFLSNLAVVFYKEQLGSLYSLVSWQRSGCAMASSKIHFQKWKNLQ